MNHPLYYTPEEAEAVLRKYGPRALTAEAIRYQAHEDPSKLGFPVTVAGSRIYIPRRSFNIFFGIAEQED